MVKDGGGGGGGGGEGEERWCGVHGSCNGARVCRCMKVCKDVYMSERRDSQ